MNSTRKITILCLLALVTACSTPFKKIEETVCALTDRNLSIEIITVHKDNVIQSLTSTLTVDSSEMNSDEEELNELILQSEAKYQGIEGVTLSIEYNEPILKQVITYDFNKIDFDELPETDNSEMFETKNLKDADLVFEQLVKEGFECK